MAERKKLEKVLGEDGLPLRGVFVFPKLNTPDTKFKPEGEYQVRLRVDAETAAPVMAKIDAMAQAALDEAKAELISKGKKPQAAKLKLAADKPYRMAMDADGNETGEVEFNFKMKASGKRDDGTEWHRKPAIFDAKGKQMDNPPAIWGGTIGRVSAEYNPFCTAIGAGVSLRLLGVKILELKAGGERSASDYGFGEEEDGYEDESGGLGDDESGGTPAGNEGAGGDDAPPRF